MWYSCHWQIITLSDYMKSGVHSKMSYIPHPTPLWTSSICLLIEETNREKLSITGEQHIQSKKKCGKFTKPVSYWKHPEHSVYQIQIEGNQQELHKGQTVYNIFVTPVPQEWVCSFFALRYSYINFNNTIVLPNSTISFKRCRPQSWNVDPFHPKSYL